MIEQLVASRDGVVTLDEALSSGLSSHQVPHRVRTGRWIRLHPRVYLVERRDPDVTVCTRAAVAWAGSGAVASGLTAAWWWGLREAPGVTEVTVPWRRSLRRQAGIVVQRRDLDPADLVVSRGLAVTALPLTVLEGAAALGNDSGRQLVDRALQRRDRHQPEVDRSCPDGSRHSH